MLQLITEFNSEQSQFVSNMNRISLDHALLELQDMFPQYDREMLEEVIREHRIGIIL